MSDDKTARIRALNDAFRKSFAGGMVTCTVGVSALDKNTRNELYEAVRAFDNFDGNNDPFGEHDFGSVAVSGQTYYWKIDYYNPALDAGSEDPSDPEQTTRVMTIMEAGEY